MGMDDDDRANVNPFSWFSFFPFSREILNGIAVTDENGNKLGHSTVSSQDVWIKTTIFPVTFDIWALSLSLWQKAAVKGISQVVISRITMAAPGMSTPQHHMKLFKCSCTSPNLFSFSLLLCSVILPIIMQRLEKYKFMQRITYLHGPIQVMMVGVL